MCEKTHTNTRTSFKLHSQNSKPGWFRNVWTFFQLLPYQPKVCHRRFLHTFNLIHVYVANNPKWICVSLSGSGNCVPWVLSSDTMISEQYFPQCHFLLSRWHQLCQTYIDLCLNAWFMFKITSRHDLQGFILWNVSSFNTFSLHSHNIYSYVLWNLKSKMSGGATFCWQRWLKMVFKWH